MNRKNTIVLALLVNAGIFLLLFVAVNRGHQEDQLQTPLDQTMPLANLPKPIEQRGDAPTRQPTADPFSILQETRAAQADVPQYLEITARRGDQLDRLAVVYGTSPEEIMRLNSLSSATLSPGQILKIPLTVENTQAAAETLPERGALETKEPLGGASAEKIYYIVKRGDSPWSIAHKHKIKLEELLRINDLDERKARRLREGDRLRVS